MSETTDWKTVRIQAEYYYKLNELSGFFQLVLGNPLPMGAVNAWAIQEYYDIYVPKLKQLITNPDELEKIRTQWRTYWEKMAKLTDAQTSREIHHFFGFDEDREREGWCEGRPIIRGE